MIDDAAERGWAAEWIAAILAREKIDMTPEAKEHLWSALSSLASAPISERTLTGLSVLLQSQSLKRALQPYCLGGPFGRLLDAEAERLGSAPVQAFETEGLIGTGAAPAVLAYLFHRIEGQLDGRPTLLIIDEGWLALDDEGFAGQIREWLKTLRKKNASVVFATQSLSDIDGSAIAPAIIESCPTRLFLPNERAIEPQISAIYRRFGLNDRQIEILARATPKRDYYCQSRRGNRLFELGLERVRARLHRGLLEVRPGHDRARARRTWPRRLRHRLARRAWAGLGRRSHSRSHQAGRFVMMGLPSPRGMRAIAIAIACAAPPASAQLIVFDPNNYAQNVLTAARELQQINNQIASLQNQAQMLINQAQKSRQPAVFLAAAARAVGPANPSAARPGPAHRLRYQTDRSSVLDDLCDGLQRNSEQALIANAQTRWQNSVAGLQDALRVQATVVGNLDTNRKEMSALVSSSQGATGALQASSGRQSAPCACRRSSSPI